MKEVRTAWVRNPFGLESAPRDEDVFAECGGAACEEDDVCKGLPLTNEVVGTAGRLRWRVGSTWLLLYGTKGVDKIFFGETQSGRTIPYKWGLSVGNGTRAG